MGLSEDAKPSAEGLQQALEAVRRTFGAGDRGGGQRSHLGGGEGKPG